VPEANPNSRLETFCDGVFAIALTLLILNIAIPSTMTISSNTELWLALKKIIPSIFAFLLSFIVIFITWVNHHASLKLVNKSSPSFIYANGLLLLTVVLMPFPTALLGEYLLTDYSSPAIILYNAVTTFQALAWVLLTGAALRHKLTKSDQSTRAMRRNNRAGYAAIVVYLIGTIAAYWLPHTIVALTAVLWIFWLIYGINIKDEQT
jgi:uncharacterized membrane protein